MSSNTPDHTRLSKTVAHALRHAPWMYELEPDDQGWVTVDALLEGLRGRGRAWRDLTETDLADMVKRSDKRRYEMQDDRIRALYGHSLPGRLSREPAPPPSVLFHGTSSRFLPSIRQDGLRPMGRQYVHLSADEETAREVANRKPPPHVILHVDAGRGAEAGVRFYRGNDKVWLADAIPPTFIALD